MKIDIIDDLEEKESIGRDFACLFLGGGRLNTKSRTDPDDTVESF